MQYQSPRRVQTRFFFRVSKKTNSPPELLHQDKFRTKSSKFTSRANQQKAGVKTLEIDNNSLRQILRQSRNQQLFNKMQRSIQKNRTISSGSQVCTKKLREKFKVFRSVNSQENKKQHETIPSFIIEKCYFGFRNQNQITKNKDKTVQETKPNTAKNDSNKFNRNNMYITDLVNRIKFAQQKPILQFSHFHFNGQPRNEKYQQLFGLTQSRVDLISRQSKQKSMIYQRQSQENITNRKINKLILYGKKANQAQNIALKSIKFRKTQFKKKQSFKNRFDKTRTAMKHQDLQPWDFRQFNQDQDSYHQK